MRPRLQAPGLLLAIFLALAVAPLLLTPYYRIVLAEILVWGLFGMAFDLLFGYTGMLSFGQALFFGAGAYGAAYAIFRLGAGLWGSLAFAVVVASLFAAAVGFFAVRVSGHYFLVLTITFSVLIFLVLESGHWRWITGGYSGRPFPAPPIMLGSLRLPLTNSLAGYYFVLVTVGGAYGLCHRLLSSGLGWVFLSIRENEPRARLLGYNVDGYKLLAFSCSGFLAGLAGGLYALTSQYTNLSFFHWTISTNAVVWTVIGGTGTLLGPFLGSGLFIVGGDFLSAKLPNFPILIGLAPFVRYGSFPNYFTMHNAPAAILESIRMRPPLAELWRLVTDEPIYEFGVRDRFGFIALQFVATPHSLVTMLVLPPLVALSLLLLARSLAVLRQRGGVALPVAGLSTSTVASLFGASTSAVACCGASSGPVFLTLLGLGFGTAGVIVDYAEVLEAGGYLLLLGNLVALAGWLGRAAEGRPASLAAVIRQEGASL